MMHKLIKSDSTECYNVTNRFLFEINDVFKLSIQQRIMKKKMYQGFHKNFKQHN